MKSIKFTYIFLVVTLLLAGCRKDESSTEIITNPNDDPTIEVISGVTGLVKDESGVAISGASVSIYNRSVMTDENGVFYVNNVGLNRSTSTISVEKEGYFTGYKSFIPTLGKKAFVELQLVDRGSPVSINASSGGEISMNGGAKLVLPPNSIVEKDGGAAYTGTLNVYTHWYDPTAPDLGLTMPGNLTAIQGDEEVQLGTYGMIAVELETAQGKSLQLAPNTTAQLQFPVPNTLQPPSSIALWSFDEMDGVWVQEGSADLKDGVYQAEVSHFSFWNCDAPFPLVKLTGRLMQEGNPLTNFRVSISAEGLTAGYGYTNNEGVFQGKVPRDRDLTITIRHCGETIYSEVLGSYSQDVDLGDIEVELLNFITVIKGRLLNCTNGPLSDGYGVLRSGELIEQILTPQADGTFEAIVIGCQNDNFTVQFFDPVTVKGTDLMDLNIDLDVNDLGDIRVCDGLDEFVQIFVNGDALPLISNSDVYISNEQKLILRARDQGSILGFDLDVFATNIGNYNPSTVSLTGASGNNVELSMMCGDHTTNYFTCDQFQVDITEFGQFVSGTFIGKVYANADSLALSNFDFTEYAIDGSFRVSIDEYIKTGEISGQFWLDENGSNTRDDDEDKSLILQTVNIRRLDGGEINLFPRFLNTYSQSYKFTNLEPGSYQVRLFRKNGYELVQKDVGSEDRDCDFLEEGDIHITEVIDISSMEIIENVDAGFQVPTSITCGDVRAIGCFPNLQVSMYINGGVPPYTVTLNGTQTEEFMESAFFDVPDEGVYFFEVVDQVGNTCSDEGSIDNYSNRMNGRVWRDVEGGTPNFYDSNIDFLSSDIPILLYDENGNLRGGTVCQNGFYTITNIPPGNYYLEVDVPSSLEILEQNINTSTGNDINPETNRSNIFTIGDCEDTQRLDVGLKQI